MPRYIQFLSFCYRMLLRLYPTELRSRYGDEMTAVFGQFLRDAYVRSGTRGAAFACARAFGEFFTVALPRHLVSDWLIAASLSLVITTGVLGSLVGVMTATHPICVSHNRVILRMVTRSVTTSNCR
jgi:hypothetical protein